jgi:hypothetical protein
MIRHGCPYLVHSDRLQPGSCTHLSNRDIPPNSASSQLHLMAHLSRWLAAQGLDVHMLRDRDLERFLRARRRAGYARWLSMKAMRSMLTYLKDRGVSLRSSAEGTRQPADGAVDRYRQYLLRERGLGQRTVKLYSNAIRSCEATYPATPSIEKFQTDPHWRALVLFHEYFHGDIGAGLGASHQTGWTRLDAKLMQQSGEHCNASDSATAIAAD